MRHEPIVPDTSKARERRTNDREVVCGLVQSIASVSSPLVAESPSEDGTLEDFSWLAHLPV